WAAWALLSGVIALLFWARGSELGLHKRLVAARARLTAPVLRLAGVAIVLAVAFGGFIFYNTNILNEYLSWDRSGAPQAEYERRYSRSRELPQPVVTAADLRSEIYPEQKAVHKIGTYRVVNRTVAPIRTVHVETRGYRV